MTLIEDKIIKGIDRKTGQECHYMRYVLEENGVKKRYETKLKGEDGDPSYLVQRLAEFNEGDVIVLEYKKAGMKGYIDVSSADGPTPIDEHVEEEEVDGELINIDD